MGTTDVLRSSIQGTHERLTERLESARAVESPRDRPREAQERIDGFLATASKHLHAVDAVLLPAARKQLAHGGTVAHDCVRSVKDLEVVLAHVKAHEYGSVYETSVAWSDVWSDVQQALADHRRHEQIVGQWLTEALADDELEDLTARLQAAELTGPTRPHPYTPHTGLPGRVSRKVMHAADALWDTLEGRMVPVPARAPKERPGLLAQYFLADPRFDEEEPQPPEATRGTPPPVG